MKVYMVLAVVGVLGGATLSSAYDNPLVYEGFDYPDTHIWSDGSGTAGGKGWGGPWEQTKNPYDVNPPGTSFGDLMVNGFAAKSALGTWSQVNRSTGSTLDGYLSDGGELWFSIIMDNSLAGGSKKNVFAFGAGGLSTSTDESGFPSGKEGVGIFRSNYGSTFAGDIRDGNLWSGVGEQDVGVLADTDTLFVGHLQWGADEGADDTLTIYLPDTALNQGEAVVTATLGAMAQDAFDTVSLRLKDHARMDEIRFGPTYKDVVGLSDVPATVLIFW